uniref:Uncharacterized protein n=2 Tax=Magallana gigas TaxID=29159 RepID=A0A8W8N4W0_MAGGI
MTDSPQGDGQLTILFNLILNNNRTVSDDNRVKRTPTRTLPQEPRGEGYFTADNGGDQKIKAYTQMYKTLPWNVGGHRVQLHLAKAGTMTSYFHINLICLHHDQTGPVSDGGHQTVPGLTKAFLKVVV